MGSLQGRDHPWPFGRERSTTLGAGICVFFAALKKAPRHSLSRNPEGKSTTLDLIVGIWFINVYHALCVMNVSSRLNQYKSREFSTDGKISIQWFKWCYCLFALKMPT